MSNRGVAKDDTGSGQPGIVQTGHLYPSQTTELCDRIDARFQSLSGVGVGLEESKIVPMAV